MTTDNTNKTEQLKSGPIVDSEIDAWENALSADDKIQLRRLQLQQASIARAAVKRPPTDSEVANMDDATFRAYCRSLGLPG